MIYRVVWHTAKGPLAVEVEATVETNTQSARVGAVSVTSVRLNTGEGDWRPAGLTLDLGTYMAAERQDLYQRLREAAGLCPKCMGQRRYSVHGRKNGKSYKKRVACTTCSGSGKAVRT